LSGAATLNWQAPTSQPIEYYISCEKSDNRIMMGWLGGIFLPAELIGTAKRRDLLAGVIAHELSHFYFFTFERNQRWETAADERGAQLLAAAGYPPATLIESLGVVCEFYRAHGKPEACDASDTHPSIQDRKQHLTAFIRAIRAPSPARQPAPVEKTILDRIAGEIR
jgi:predicted Zn-dependent protease